MTKQASVPALRAVRGRACGALEASAQGLATIAWAAQVLRCVDGPVGPGRVPGAGICFCLPRAHWQMNSILLGKIFCRNWRDRLVLRTPRRVQGLI